MGLYISSDILANLLLLILTIVLIILLYLNAKQQNMSIWDFILAVKIYFSKSLLQYRQQYAYRGTNEVKNITDIHQKDEKSSLPLKDDRYTSISQSSSQSPLQSSLQSPPSFQSQSVPESDSFNTCSDNRRLQQSHGYQENLIQSTDVPSGFWPSDLNMKQSSVQVKSSNSYPMKNLNNPNSPCLRSRHSYHNENKHMNHKSAGIASTTNTNTTHIHVPFSRENLFSYKSCMNKRNRTKKQVTFALHQNEIHIVPNEDASRFCPVHYLNDIEKNVKLVFGEWMMSINHLEPDLFERSGEGDFEEDRKKKKNILEEQSSGTDTNTSTSPSPSMLPVDESESEVDVCPLDLPPTFTDTGVGRTKSMNIYKRSNIDTMNIGVSDMGIDELWIALEEILYTIDRVRRMTGRGVSNYPRFLATLRRSQLPCVFYQQKWYYAAFFQTRLRYFLEAAAIRGMTTPNSHVKHFVALPTKISTQRCHMLRSEFRRLIKSPRNRLTSSRSNTLISSLCSTHHHHEANK